MSSHTRTGNGAEYSDQRTLAILVSVAGMDMLGFALIFPLLTYYALEMDATPFGIGVLIASFPLAQMVSAPLWGRISDSYGRRPVILVSILMSMVSFIVFGFANSFAVLLLSRVVQGAGGGTVGVLHAYVSDVVEPKERARSLGWLSAAASAGTMVGPVLGSVASGWGNSAPGLAAAAFAFVNLLLATFWLRERRRGEGGPPGAGKPVWTMAASVLVHPGSIVPRLVWIHSLGMLAFSFFTAVLTLYLDGRFGIDAARIGYVFLYTGGLSVVLRSFALGPLVVRFGETRTMRIGAVLMTAAFVGLPFASGVWSFMAIMTLVPAGTALMFPTALALVSQRTEKRELGTTMGTAQSFAGMARTVAPLTATWMFNAMGPGSPFLGAAMIAAVALLFSRNVEGGSSAP